MAEDRSPTTSADWQPVYHTPMRIWVATIMIIVGFAVGGVGIVLKSAVVAIIGAVIVVVSSIAAWALGIMRNVH